MHSKKIFTIKTLAKNLVKNPLNCAFIFTILIISTVTTLNFFEYSQSKAIQNCKDLSESARKECLALHNQELASHTGDNQQQQSSQEFDKKASLLLEIKSLKEEVDQEKERNDKLYQQNRNNYHSKVVELLEELPEDKRNIACQKNMKFVPINQIEAKIISICNSTKNSKIPSVKGVNTNQGINQDPDLFVLQPSLF